jgi:hypothetical protein
MSVQYHIDQFHWLMSAVLTKGAFYTVKFTVYDCCCVKCTFCQYPTHQPVQ